MKYIVSLFLLIFALEVQAQDKRLAGLDTFINRVLKEWKAVGVSVAVVEKNKVLLAKGYGYRDLDKKLPVTDETLFAIGSCTKAFTSTLLGMLVSEGKLDLDKPVNQYIPGLRFYNDALTSQVTTRDMMSHRTGLPRHDMSWYGSSVSRDSLVYRIRYFQPSATLREKWQYNNYMFLAQGYLAEQLTGTSWEKLLQQKIFTPLGMSFSSPSITALSNGSNSSLGYKVEKDSLIKKIEYMNIDAMGPAGSINSNARDMARWVQTWINGGMYNTQEVIPAAYHAQAMSSQMVISGALPSKEISDVFLSNYGMGWVLASYRGHYRVEHGGNIDGFSASTSFFPTDSIGIVVLVNQNGSSLPGIIRNTIVDRMLGLGYRDWSGIQMANAKKAKAAEKDEQKADSSAKKMGTRPSHSLNDYTGTYSHPGYGSFIIRMEGDSLKGSYNKTNLTIKHYMYDVFSAIPSDEASAVDESDALKLSFTMDEGGNINAISAPLELSVDPIILKKEIKTISLSKELLEKYTGNYEIQGATVKVYLREDNTLMASVPGQPDYELLPTGEHAFTIRVLSGYSIVFEAGAKNAITGLKFVQPNGTFKATKKTN